MSTEEVFAQLSPVISAALESRGFTSLTPIQEAVLDPAFHGRDLRLFSQTGSGKTVAVGLVLAPELERVAKERAAAAPTNVATPAVILIAPTRELAAQLARELTWLFQPLGASVCAVTGGTSYVHELRALKRGPLVVVGTPGRLLDHLNRKSIDASQVSAAVLDEADQMLDMGFREDLEAILGKFPEARRTHLVAATFSREVRALADRYQKDAVPVEGTTLGEANVDISHVAHLVQLDERANAIINLLLLAPGERALVFVRTREGAAELADILADAGFRALSLSGELEQRERTRTLEAFRSGSVSVLVATDVAARGLDIADVNRVIHADPPGDAETFTHRSGRTGRAGRKGTNVILVPPVAREYALRLFRQARVTFSWAPVPTPADVLREADVRLRAELTTTPETPAEPRLRALAESLLAEADPAAVVAGLLARIRHTGPTEPRLVTPIAPPAARPMLKPRTRERRPFESDRPAYPSDRPQNQGDRRPYQSDRPPAAKLTVPRASGPQAFVPFRVTWGGKQGADPRRLLALVCRRGGITSDLVGAIHVGDRVSTVEVAERVVPDFTAQAQMPDERDPRIKIELMEGSAGPMPLPRPPRRGPIAGAPPKKPFAPKPHVGGTKPPKRKAVRSAS